MRRMLLGLMVLGLIVPAAYAASTFSPSAAQIQGMTAQWAAGGSTYSGFTETNATGGATFEATMQAGDGKSDGWAAMGVGYGWQPPVGLRDLSGYDSYSLTFLNTNNSNWLVNLWVNTGWTDPPYNQPNNFYQNGWTELAPGESAVLTVDLTGAVNLDHVTGIGFQIGGNMDVYPLTLGNPSNPDAYHMLVTQTVPAPAALLLAGIGTGLVGWLRRRRSV